MQLATSLPLPTRAPPNPRPLVCGTTTLQATTYIIAYPQQPQYQFQYQWWIIQFELFVFLLTAACTVFPSIIKRMRPVALTFIASALVLVMDNINGELV